jgi:hypothetical protein
MPDQEWPIDPETGRSVVHLDSNPESADWTKGAWDFHEPLSVQADYIVGAKGTPRKKAQAKLNAFMELPVARARPDAVKDELKRRGLRVPPATYGQQ